MAKVNDRFARIVCGGGWLETGETWKPWAVRFRLLSFFWLFPSGGAVLLFGWDVPRWFQAPALAEGLMEIRLEQWVGLLLIACHGLWIVLAIYFHRRERPQARLIPNPDHDLNKLY